MRTGSQGSSQGINDDDTLRGSNKDNRVIPESIFDTRPTLVKPALSA